MYEQKFFKYKIEPDLFASQIGVSRWDWEFAKSSTDEETAKVIMSENKYDVLPIKENNEYKEYFATRTWNKYTSLNLYKIEDANTIYYRLTFRDLIKKFSSSLNKRYFFLTSHDDHIIGLISLVNFNSLPVYNYLYQEIASFEINMTEFLKKYISEEEIVLCLEKDTSDDSKNSLARYNELYKKGNHGSIYDYLYLNSFNSIITKNIDKIPDKHRKIINISRKIQHNFTNVRNTVMHPSKSLFIDHDSFKKVTEVLENSNALYEFINSIEDK